MASGVLRNASFLKLHAAAQALYSGNPSRASLMAGARLTDSGSLPYFFARYARPAGSPGIPAASAESRDRPGDRVAVLVEIHVARGGAGRHLAQVDHGLEAVAARGEAGRTRRRRDPSTTARPPRAPPPRRPPHRTHCRPWRGSPCPPHSRVDRRWRWPHGPGPRRESSWRRRRRERRRRNASDDGERVRATARARDSFIPLRPASSSSVRPPPADARTPSRRRRGSRSRAPASRR